MMMIAMVGVVKTTFSAVNNDSEEGIRQTRATSVVDELSISYVRD